MGVGKVFQEVRKKHCSQLQFALDNNIVRESVSAYETERARLPQDISRKAIQRFDSPRLAFEVASQYTGGSWLTWLDGNNVDLHRASVRSKVKEELREALDAIAEVSLANHPHAMQDFERRKLEHSIEQSIDAIYALSMYVARVCEDYGYSWQRKWDKHRQKLVARRYVKA
ncbi:hypothetical protein [Desulfuribacillus stibiiarsenatis]|uniref:hypothetical protein n=1 Tax=Desulfuribacillus stibiiarsenatis TaxID=1390249 RepID=UPI0009F5C5BB|nr:hypothetical protein [Desulfuribacillus stibiiarsenatis]